MRVTKTVTKIPIKFGNRLNRAFKELESKGIMARQNYACCMSCGFAEMENEIDASGESWIGMVFYHHQDNDSRKKGLDFHLAYDSNNPDISQEEIGKMVCESLKNNGIEFEWNNNPKSRIMVMPK